MSYTLHGDLRSGSAIIEALLAEIGAPVELVDVPLSSEDQRGESYAALNPQRKLPTLITPDGETLTESAAIVVTLAERHPEAALLPTSPTLRARALRWLMFAATELYPIVEIIDYPERFAPATCAPDEVRERAREIWRKRLAVIESQVEGPFLLGDFSATDVYLAVVTRWGVPASVRATVAPTVEALASAVAARPAIAPVWKRHFGE